MLSDQTHPAAGATRTLAAFASGLQYDAIPPSVIARMKTSLIDSIGCCLFGISLPWTRHVLTMALEDGCRPAAPVFGTGERTSAGNAALVSATAGHAFELDDIHKESIVHPGSLALPAIAALAGQAGPRSGRDWLAALTAGYEIGTRVGNAATMQLFFRGFHPQGTSGCFVAAAAAARMLELDAGQTLHAYGIAGSQASGLMAAQEGAMVKRLHAGRAAQGGVMAALLARRGFTGITNVLEADYGGFLATYSGAPDPVRLTDGLGVDWEAGKVGYKPYASVTSIHAAQDALRAICRENRLTADDIARIRVGVSAMTHVHCAWPYRAQGVTAAQMNLFFGLAVIAVDDEAFVAQYREDRLNDPRLLALISRMEAYADPQIDAMGPAFRHAARLEVHTRGGAVLRRDILHRRGSPENPLSHDDVVAKFHLIAAEVIDESRAREIVSRVEELDHLQDASALLALLEAPIRAR
ncbi:MmgE/PrpD family protein [Achromobacter animicus]|uniref:MmgE/PrpD family protein n=1 Tax=Achromobacter animicus TaxID=1389935 RepID=UPI0028A998E3|nr:MmgE/PrpD family protein [Achromobacter animicus]